MSAFACGPAQGSEEGVGWNWALEAARQGHQVRVLTQTRDKQIIEAELAKGTLPSGLSFDFMMPRWLELLRLRGLMLGYDGLTLQIVHLFWQFAALAHVRRHYAPDEFDIVHHITYGGIRHPTLLGRVGIPLVLGPIGGGDSPPYALRKAFHWMGWIKDLVRDLHTWSLRLDPITRGACRDALVVYAKTPQSRAALPRCYHDKIDVRLEVGTHCTEAPARSPTDPNAPLRLMYAGRFIYLKGMRLGLEAVAEAARRDVDVHLTMVGAGPDEEEWRRLAETLGLAARLDWRGWVPHENMGTLYTEHDALLFPSLRESSGNVVLEALVNGLPVICFDMGGPAQMVDSCSGRLVAARGCTERQCIEGLADAIEELAVSPALRVSLNRGAYERAQTFHWSKVVGDLYADVKRRRLRQRAAGAAMPPKRAAYTGRAERSPRP